MARYRSAIVFLLQSIVVGLACAFVVVLIRPDLLPTLDPVDTGRPVSFADAVARSGPSVASVYTKRLVPESSASTARTRFRINTSAASAVIIDPQGYLVTNFHVVAEAAEIQVYLTDGTVTEPVLVGVDAETDLAVLRVDVGELPAIPLGTSASLRPGDVVLAIGNPYNLAQSVTQGIVSATGRGRMNLATFEDFIQTDAAINSGNSGGALINSRGELVGINTAVLAQDAGTEGIGFAIPVDLVRGVVEEIKKNGRVIRGYMGLTPDELTSAERLALGIDSDIGILLLSVFEGGPAAQAGLRADDVILTINGEAIREPRQALLAVAGTSPGDEVEVTVWRDGERFRTTVVAGERPPEEPATISR